MREFQEGRLRFHFPDEGLTVKYDESTFYRKRLQHIPCTAAVDFIHASLDGGFCLIEVKDYGQQGGRPATKEHCGVSHRFEEHLAWKVRDTISGLLAVLRTGEGELHQLARRLFSAP